MKELNDLSLVTRVAVLHDRRAFDTLVRKYQSPVRRFFLHQTLGDEQLSDDLAQDTFVKAYTHITAFRGLSGFSTWLFRIAYNVFYDYMRSHRQQADLDTPEVARRTAAHADTSLALDVYDALALLADRERTCITPPTHRGTAHRQDFRNHGYARGHREVAPVEGERKIS